MQEKLHTRITLDDTSPSLNTGAKDPAAAPPGGGRSRTAASGREFLHAIRSDVAALGGLSRRHLAGARRRIAHALSSTTARRSFASPGTRVLRRFAIGLVALAVFGALSISGAMLWALHDLPLERTNKEATKPALLLETSDGEPLGRIGPLKTSEVSREELPEHLVQAVLSIEDRRFYSHFGVDLLGIARALRRNVAAGDIVEGGSTITQQLVKMRFVGNDRTFTRKLREALTAVWLELRIGKDEILTRYLNSVYMGAGAHGMAAAARLYFDKRPSELTLSEAALLAGLIKAPSKYNPLRDAETAWARAAIVIDAMVENGAIDSQAAIEAKVRPPALNLAPEAVQAGSWFADWAAKEAAEVTAPFTRSVRVRTTLVPELQRLAEQVINDALAGPAARAGVSQAALIALQPDGAVLAMVGGRDYRNSQFNRAVEANRHPGSAFKLFVYLAALRNGFGPQDTIDAGPVEIKGWRPENFDGRDYGRITLARAFAQSINTAAVRLAMKVGLDEVISAARDLGVDARLSAVPSLALGAVEVSLLDLTGAFASVRAGRMVQPWGIAALGDDQSKVRAMGAPVGSEKSLGPHQQPMLDLLRLVVERGTGRAAASSGFVGGKTGTSQNHRDAWFIGFNEALVVGVWVGNDDGAPMQRVVGGTLPASIWKRFVTEATDLVGKDRPLVARGLDDGDGPEAYVKARQESFAQPAQCDYRACSGQYRSFRASDCTYQPYRGARRLCEVGATIEMTGQAPRSEAETQAQSGRQVETSSRAAPKAEYQAQSAQPVEKSEQAPQAIATRGRAQCNADVCARSYRSFDPSDCTYQPHDGGPRKFCEIGARSGQTSKQVTQAATEAKTRTHGGRAIETSGQASRSAINAPAEAKCNVNVCARFYRSFNPSDCTYQPHDGGARRICER